MGARDRLDADETGRERMAKFNALLQSAYLLVGIRAAGLAAGPMTGFDPAGVDAEFFPDGRHRSLVVVNVGHPAEDAFRDRQPRLRVRGRRRHGLTTDAGLSPDRVVSRARPLACPAHLSRPLLDM